MTERPVYAAVAEGLARQGHIQSAVEACYKSLESDRSGIEVHCLLAELMLSGDFYQEAIASASRAIELDPSCAPAYLALGLAYDRVGGMWDQSILVWHELAEVEPTLVTAHVQLGEAFAAATFDEQAIDAWRRALELNPAEPRAMYNMAIAALKKEGMATALPGFRKAGELDSSQDDLFFALAGIYDDGNPAPDPSEVPKDRQSRLDAAGALAYEEDYFSSSELLRSILDENADDAEALGLASYLYLKQEALNEAMACAFRALTISTRVSTAVYVLGVALSRLPGLNRNATRIFGVLAKAVPSHAMTHVLYAESLLGLQRYEHAADSYRVALALDPACVRARFGLAAVLLTEGEYSAANWEMRRAAYHDTHRRRLFWDLFDAYKARRS